MKASTSDAFLKFYKKVQLFATWDEDSIHTNTQCLTPSWSDIPKSESQDPIGVLYLGCSWEMGTVRMLLLMKMRKKCSFFCGGRDVMLFSPPYLNLQPVID